MVLGRGRRRRSISAPQFPIPPEAQIQQQQHPPMMHHSRSYCYDPAQQRVPHQEAANSSVVYQRGQPHQQQQQQQPQGQHQAELAAGMTPYSRIIEKYITSNDNTNYHVGFNKRMDHNPMFGVSSSLPVEKSWETSTSLASPTAVGGGVESSSRVQRQQQEMQLLQQQQQQQQYSPEEQQQQPYRNNKNNKSPNRRPSYDVERSSGYSVGSTSTVTLDSEIRDRSNDRTTLWMTVILPTIISRLWKRYKDTFMFLLLSGMFIIKITDRNQLPRILGGAGGHFSITRKLQQASSDGNTQQQQPRPAFVYTHPYVTSSYYTSTSDISVLEQTDTLQVIPKKDRASDVERGIETRLAILRPFCEFDADALPTTFACWNSLVPCRAAEMDLGEDDEEVTDEWVLFDMSIDGDGRKLNEDEEDDWDCEETGTDDDIVDNSTWFRGFANSIFKRCKRKKKAHTRRRKEFFDDVPADALKTTAVDLFLFYSQTFSENPVAMTAVDAIMKEFYSVGGWSRCFDNIYAVEANIPKELDLYIPAAQEELYNWVNGPNRQYEAGFRIVQSGEWGEYDGFYLMEGDSVPVKNYWLDVILGEISSNRPFAVLGAQYDGDKWDTFYEAIPISLLHHTNGNAIYNTSHPLLERMTGQLEVEAPCPYNSIPYDYRMSQMWVEGTLGIVPKLAPKIMLNEESENITLSDNIRMFTKWANMWKDENPYKFTKAIHNYASTNLIPRHLGPEYVIHGAKLYSPWDPARTKITLVISEWFFDRSLNLIKKLDSQDHPFDEVIIMIPPSVSNTHYYSDYTDMPVKLQFRDTPDFMDLCTAQVSTEWFMVTNSYHQVSRHVDLMFTPGKFVPVVPFTPATYPFCLKYPYCKEIVLLAQRWNPRHKQVVLDMDMLYNTAERNNFCKEWTDRNGEHGEHLYARHQPLRWKLRNETIVGPNGPTGTDYLSYLTREKKDGMYKMTDRSLYGARAPFVKVFSKEEKLDGMSEDELARRLGMTLLSNTTECSCDVFETEEECTGSGIGCQWRPLFESCHPPELIDDSPPICDTTEPPTMAPSISIERLLRATDAPTVESEGDAKEWRHWHWWIAPEEAESTSPAQEDEPEEL